jgi:hypothetical protein
MDLLYQRIGLREEDFERWLFFGRQIVVLNCPAMWRKK